MSRYINSSLKNHRKASKNFIFKEIITNERTYRLFAMPGELKVGLSHVFRA